MFGIAPSLAIRVIAGVPVYAFSQSIASDLFFVVTGTARSEPPMKVGMYWPLMWLGIGYAPMCPARAGLPSFGSSAYGHSQPLPMNEPTLPLAKTSACCG